MVIRSIIENDLYKFSMSHYYQVNYPNAWGTFAFHDRNNTEYTEEFVDLLKKEFKELDKLFLQRAEFDWCVKNIPYIPQYYWEWLQGFRYNSYGVLLRILNRLSFKIMIRIDVDKIIPSNCPFGRDDCIRCGSYELAHDEIICHECDSDCYDNENTY